MTPARIALMGFGRLGRNVMRQVLAREDINVVAISDLAEPEAMAYLLRFDTIYGRLAEEVVLHQGHLTAGRHRARIVKAGRPEEMPWGELGVDVVVEATHAFRRRDDLNGHLAAGARRVILSTPPLDAIDRILLHGVNHRDLAPGDRIVSCGSSTTQVLGLMLKILDDAGGVEAALKTTVHAYTSDQSLADAARENLRLSRSAAENLIPNWSWSPGVVTSILPSLRGRLDGIAINVPVSNGSNLDLVVQLRRPLAAADINRIVLEAAEGPCAPWLEYATEPLVSRDVLGNPHSGVFDSLATLALPTGLVKLVTWYDNGWGYAARIVETIGAMASLGATPS